MQEHAIIEAQRQFFKQGGAGCLFAAHAAKDPSKYGWKTSISNVEKHEIEALVQSAIAASDVAMQSIIFPEVLSRENLKSLLILLRDVTLISLEQEEEFAGSICLGYRTKIGDLVSWVTGFGRFDFLPKTRQSPFTEIVFRAKQRPPYEWVMKVAPPGVVHLADMEMKGMGERQFKALWLGSFAKAEEILGQKPDLRSAAKTTFAIPRALWIQK